MDLLTAPFETVRSRTERGVLLPVVQVVMMASALLTAGLLLELRGGWGSDVGRSIEVAAIHGGFIAIGFILALEGAGGWHGVALGVGVTIFLTALLARLVPWGALASVLTAGVLAFEGLKYRGLARFGLGRRVTLSAVVAGLAAGAFLGGHLLVAASMTLGYSARDPSSSGYLRALAYDIGANALSAEWLFRGVLFSEWWRRWGFWPGTLGSTGLALVRYLLDPALPRTIEVAAGAVFYLSVLSVTACALRAWSGSLLPGYLASVLFFAAYRTLLEW